MTSPSAIYYVLLYFFIFLLRFFKVYPQVRDFPAQYNKWHYGFVSLEIVYTAAGVTILLLASRPEWIAVIMLSYALLLVTSSYLDTVGARFPDKVRFGAHILIILLVVSATLFAFSSVLEDPTAAKTREIRKATQYRVAIPYVDLTLDRHLGGGKLAGILFGYFTTVEAVSREEAVAKADEQFRGSGEKSVRLFKPNREKDAYNVSTQPQAIVVERLEARRSEFGPSPR